MICKQTFQIFRRDEDSDKALNNYLSLSNWRHPQYNKYEKLKLK